LAKGAKTSATKSRQSSALDRLLKVGTDVKRLYDEPEFRDLVASALLFAAKALREDGKGGKKAPTARSPGKAGGPAAKASTRPKSKARKSPGKAKAKKKA
jgi:hypothetical protein